VAEAVLGVALAADADAEAGEALRAEGLDDRAHAVVGAGRAARLDAQLADGEIDFVENDHQIVGRIEIRVHQQPHRIAGKIHVRQRLGHLHRAAADAALAGHRLLFVSADLDAELLREGVDDHPARVVARSGVTLSRIAEADDEFHSEYNPRRMKPSRAQFEHALKSLRNPALRYADIRW